MEWFENKISTNKWKSLRKYILPEAFSKFVIKHTNIEDDGCIGVIFKPELKYYLCRGFDGLRHDPETYTYWEDKLEKLNKILFNEKISPEYNVWLNDKNSFVKNSVFDEDYLENLKEKYNYNWIPGDFLEDFIKDFI